MPLIGVFPHADRSVVIIADKISCVPVSDTVLIHFPFLLQKIRSDSPHKGHKETVYCVAVAIKFDMDTKI